MSRVTNVLLSIGTDEEDEEKIEEVNRFFTTQKSFVSLDDKSLPFRWYGGSKALECYLYAGAFNGLDLEGLIEHLRSITWEYPEDIQLIVKEQEDTKFRIIDIFPEK